MENSKIHILVVDDDPDILFATARLMKKEGFIVTTATNGKECFKQVHDNKPDIILLDVELPDMLGTDICSKIKSDSRLNKIYIMMLSGNCTSSGQQADGLDKGADGYIARPVSNRELRARVHSMVRLVHSERKCDQYILELEQALEKVKLLSGIIPICMHCKQIRDDKGYWDELEIFIEKHSEAQFSHGICEKCVSKHFPELDDE